jgi:hypothetical protein
MSGGAEVSYLFVIHVGNCVIEIVITPEFLDSLLSLGYVGQKSMPLEIHTIRRVVFFNDWFLEKWGHHIFGYIKMNMKKVIMRTCN